MFLLPSQAQASGSCAEVLFLFLFVFSCFTSPQREGRLLILLITALIPGLDLLIIPQRHISTW